MITLIHGSDTSASRKYFLTEKEKYQTAQLIDGEKVTLTDLTQIFEGGGLFEESKTIFIEHLFNRKKKKDEFEAITKYLQKQHNHTLFLWEDKELEKSVLSIFKTAVPRVFKLPQTLFVFLDALAPGNGKRLITLFHQTIETTDVEMVFFMMVRHVRLMLGLLEPAETQIDELKRIASWQQTKLVKQAEAFGKEQLVYLYNQLFTIEIGQKTGSNPNKILTSIDFLLLEI